MDLFPLENVYFSGSFAHIAIDKFNTKTTSYMRPPTYIFALAVTAVTYKM